MSDHELTLRQRINSNCKKVRDEIERECDPMDGHCLVDNMMKLKALGGLMSETVALANQELREKQAEMMKQDDPELKKIVDIFGKGYIRTWIEAECKKELALVEYCVYLDKRVSYAIEALRTAISHLKEEMNRERFGQ